MLTWHASSSKQKSDMLAIQNSDGDLRVWSVPKPPTVGQPRVIRVLKRSERFVQGRNWVSWSRNGRVIQYSEGETWAWDVRTKDVNYFPVPTIEYVKGIAAHGPTAALFTLGPDNTIQQYDVDVGKMVANIQHTPITIPPTLPEDYGRLQYYEDEVSSPLKPNRYEHESQRTQSEDPASAHTHSVSSASGASRSQTREKQPNIHDLISPAKTEQTATTFSMGAYSAYHQPQPQSALPASPASARVAASIRKGSRLRQEVIMSPMTPDDALVGDLFPFARARLSEVQQQSKPPNESNMTPDDLRKHMLTVVFGWEDDIYALIDDELVKHPRESLNALFLTKWLDHGTETVAEIMGSTPADSGLDWIRLALGILDSKSENKKLGQIFVEKMLTKGEIHMAVVALLAMGDKNDAIEVYVSNHCYLEAILLTCLLMPQDWQRQSHLVRKWGEHVVENSQQQLAIRCFACTGVEPSEAWMSPTAQMYSKMASPISARLGQTPQFPSQQSQQYLQPQQLPQQIYQPPPQPQPQPMPMPAINTHIQRMKGRAFEAPTPVALIAPPTPFRAAAARGTRITPQTGGLKLITSFNQKPVQGFKFPGLKTDDMTPTNATNITPIAESAIDRSALSPGGLGSYKLNNMASLNSALSAQSALARSRLPSIGEARESPQEALGDTPVARPNTGPRAPPTPADSGSDKEKEKMAAAKADADKQDRKERQENQLTLLTSARYTPSSTPVKHVNAEGTRSPEPQTALRPSTSTSWNNSLSRVQEESFHGRSRSDDKNPNGLSLQMFDYSEPLPRPNTTDSTTTNFAMSPSPGIMDGMRLKSPSVSGRSIDQYISSLDQARALQKVRSRNSSKAPKEKSERTKSKHRKHKRSEDVPSGKRSPSSPVPMSPEDFQNLNFTNGIDSFEAMYNSHDVSNSDAAPTERKHGRRTSASTTGTGKVRHRSRSAQPKRRESTRGREAEESAAGKRGRSRSRKESSQPRSPSSPLPMVPSEDDNAGRSSVDPALRFVAANRSRFPRSTSRQPGGRSGDSREPSPGRRKHRARSTSRDSRRVKHDSSEDARMHQETFDRLEAEAASIRNNTTNHSRASTRSKELAQAELEARRLSLARRPSAPAIPVPSLANGHGKSASEGFAVAAPLNRNNTDSVLRPTTYSSLRNEYSSSKARPGTPQAMKLRLQEGEAQQEDETLNSDSYLLPARTYSANAMRDQVEAWIPTEIPHNMPRHPAFDETVGSRSRGNSRSRTRGGSPRRGKSTERPRVLPEEEDFQPLVIGDSDYSPDPAEYRSSTGPVIVPELQHLAVPPPPPPPPAAPPTGLRIQTDLPTAMNIPLPKSAYPPEPLSATPDKPHKRVSSRNEGGQLRGKFRGFMRSNSKPRDNISRSPNMEEGIMSPYETVTMMPPPLTSINERR